MSHPITKRERIGFLALMAMAAIGLYWGWKAFWFLTDDAYIAFRYVSNSLLGHGYVWNPPPFMPVEGYTSFLWVLLLELVMRLTGVEPPTAANTLSLGFSYATLVLTSWLLMRLDWSPSLVKARIAFVALLPVFLLFNRSYLAWSSSGLETSLFCFLVALWVCVLYLVRRPIPRAFGASLAATMLALVRPDGLLFCVATLPIVSLIAWRSEKPRVLRGTILLGMIPFVGVITHVYWRLSFYGAWLPNTYYAKVTSPWPLSGLIYLCSFVLEYGLWFPFIAVCCATIPPFVRVLRELRPASRFRGIITLLKDASTEGLITVFIVSFLLVHFCYYTFVVGGDHFEYRVYNHIIPFLFLAFIWCLNKLRLKPAFVLGLALTFTLLSMPIQWTHWLLTKDLNTRRETHVMRVSISPFWPRPLRWYSQLFDDAQSWLITRHVCMRHQEHKVFWLTQVAAYPSRERGMRIPSIGYPVLEESAVGVAGWILPHVFIIDLFGLNDYVIARSPVSETELRLMGHDHWPPEGYVESFLPNVLWQDGRLKIYKRRKPLTEADIRQAESYWRDRIRDMSGSNRIPRNLH